VYDIINELAYSIGESIVGILDFIGLDELRWSVMGDNAPLAIGYLVLFVAVALLFSVLRKRDR